MVKRYCPKCNAEFNRKFCYDRHINKKFACGLKNNISIDIIDINDEKTKDLKICENLRKFAKICENEKIVQKNKIITKPNDIITKPNYIITKSNDIITKPSDIITKPNEINFVHSSNITNYCCSYCNKCYSSKYTLSRHINDICKIKKDSDNKKENIFKLLLEKDKQKEIEINELKKQNKILIDKINKLINLTDNKTSKIINNNLSTTINNDNSINQNNQIIMVNFGKEDLTIIDKQIFIDRVVKKNINGVLIPDEVFKIIHFNPMYPQLSNIYISDINRDKCMIYDNGEWKLSYIDNIQMIMDKICLFSNEQINILKEKYPNNKPLQDRLKIIEKYNNMIDDDYLDELKNNKEENKNEIIKCEKFIKHTEKTIKKTLYNEGKKIKKIIKLN